MKAKKMTALALLGGVALLTLGGCPFGDPRVTNQGGGSLFTALIKVGTSKMTTLTPDEIQLATDYISNNFGLGVFLDDTQAQDVVTFVQDYSLDSINEVRSFAENPPEGVEIPESLQTLADSNIDFSSLLP